MFLNFYSGNSVMCKSFLELVNYFSCVNSGTAQGIHILFCLAPHSPKGHGYYFTVYILRVEEDDIFILHILCNQIQNVKFKVNFDFLCIRSVLKLLLHSFHHPFH